MAERVGDSGEGGKKLIWRRRRMGVTRSRSRSARRRVHFRKGCKWKIIGGGVGGGGKGT